MAKNLPEFLLFADVEADDESGRWHFSLESVGDGTKNNVTDVEPGESSGRLELLVVIRGLEALDQPSQVTLVTTSGYVRRGIRFGMEDWRNSGWRWEHFGRMVPVTNADLWQRLGRAMEFHELKCRSCQLERIDSAHVLRGPHRRRTGAKSPALSNGVQKQAS
jgi:ribonuclease HI